MKGVSCQEASDSCHSAAWIQEPRFLVSVLRAVFRAEGWAGGLKGFTAEGFLAARLRQQRTLRKIEDRTCAASHGGTTVRLTYVNPKPIW